MNELLAEVAGVQPSIVCGDFNVTPGDTLFTQLERAGYQCAHTGPNPRPTCCADGLTRKLDYLCYGPGLSVDPCETPDLRGATTLPSFEHPSDHLPVQACFGLARDRVP